jgi:hypothetical protein
MDEIELYASQQEILDGIMSALDYDPEVIELDVIIDMMKAGFFKKLKEALLSYFEDDEELETRKRENEKITAELDAYELGY